MATVQQTARLWFHKSKSIVTVQRRFHLEYRNYQSLSKNSIKRWYEQFKGTGQVPYDHGLRQSCLLSWNQRRAFCCTVAILTLALGISHCSIFRAP
ncbi:hypothetical protein AVEN_205273-1 [Araneus ventricosus]|uniref:DUF4817 domain-containing protein n=1 Tax=Araneus ventricosus TaxID=182803 RepID=A0A4Y2GUD3_ARAVE|nr:hypothetical protein AVEN_235921-1 [Araneus ventricosus]GBM56415.1 hypothetical protein AVEN_205273-1 [Araneus ventricosus]